MRTSEFRFLVTLAAVAGLISDGGTASATETVTAVPSTQPGAQVWIENEPSYLRRGDRLNVRFSVPRDAYVAVMHIDSDGALEFLYPAGPWDDHFVRGGRTHSLPVRGSFATSVVRSRAGIGYLYLIASPAPLDFRYFTGGIGSSWDWGYAGRNVYGDPFLAFDQVTRLILPRWPYAQYAADYHSYYVDGLHRYPSYACSDRYFQGGWGWYPEYGSCSRMDYFLRDYPSYYDTRRYVGDRRIFLRQYERLDPVYGFKEPPAPARGLPSRAVAPDVRSPAGGSTGATDIQRRDPIPAPGAAPRGQPTPPTTTPQRAPATGTRQPVPQRDPASPPETGAGSAGTRQAVPQREPAATSRGSGAGDATGTTAPRQAPAPARQADPATDTRTRPVPDTGDRGASGGDRPAPTTERAPARGRP